MLWLLVSTANWNKTETVGYKSDEVNRVNFVNPTINKYLNTAL